MPATSKKRVNFYLDTQEYELLKKLCSQYHMTMTHVFRTLLDNRATAHPERANVDLTDLLKQATHSVVWLRNTNRNLVALGNNINQITHKLNSLHNINDDTITKLQAALQPLLKQLDTAIADNNNARKEMINTWRLVQSVTRNMV